MRIPGVEGLKSFVGRAFLVQKIQGLKNRADKYDRGLGPHSFLDSISEVNLDKIFLEKALELQNRRLLGVLAIALVSAIGSILIK